MESKNFAIGILSSTAIILLVGLLVIHSRPEPAMAFGMTASGGEYLLTVGAMQTRDEELVFVIHARTNKMNVYRFNVARADIERVDEIDLGKMRENAGQAQPPKRGSKRSRRRP